MDALDIGALIHVKMKGKVTPKSNGKEWGTDAMQKAVYDLRRTSHRQTKQNIHLGPLAHHEFGEDLRGLRK